MERIGHFYQLTRVYWTQFLLEDKSTLSIIEVAYSYRHTFVTEALANGVGIAQVAELMGHSSTEMVSSVYGHLADRLTHMQEAAKKAVEKS